MFRRSAMIGLLICVFLLSLVPALARGPQEKSVSVANVTSKPGRDPNQPVDEEYTRKIHEYTTDRKSVV